MTRRKAFTLVELLVVVAIIALLLSILLPSLNRARDVARNVVCLSNMKQMGTATSTYQADWNDMFPSTPYYAMPGSQRTHADWWDGQLAPYLGLDIDFSAPSYSPERGYGSIFQCPRDWRLSAHDNPVHFRSYAVPMMRGSQGGSYGLGWNPNMVNLGYSSPPTGSSLGHPAETAWILDYPFWEKGRGANLQWNPAWGAFAPWLNKYSVPNLLRMSGYQIGDEDTFAHGNVQGFLFADGHVEEHDPRDAYDSESRNWWDRD